MLYNDIGMGYFVYQNNNDPTAFIRAIVPTFETHINVPLNHIGVFRPNDPFGTPDVVDLTFGVNTLLGRRTLLSVAFINPVTGPKPFNYEWAAFMNVYYGLNCQNPGDSHAAGPRPEDPLKNHCRRRSGVASALPGNTLPISFGHAVAPLAAWTVEPLRAPSSHPHDVS